jgi:hypothetical protein
LPFGWIGRNSRTWGECHRLIVSIVAKQQNQPETVLDCKLKPLTTDPLLYLELPPILVLFHLKTTGSLFYCAPFRMSGYFLFTVVCTSIYVLNWSKMGVLIAKST